MGKRRVPREERRSNARVVYSVRTSAVEIHPIELFRGPHELS
jgi:hypothetical protein